MVLTELLQNAVEHGLAGAAGRVTVVAERCEGESLRMQVRDDGRGLPPDFSLAASDRLGLQIVRTLVESELGGQLSIAAAADGGTVAEVVVRAG
jgi:two-component sensor histidine kinase